VLALLHSWLNHGRWAESAMHDPVLDARAEEVAANQRGMPVIVLRDQDRRFLTHCRGSVRLMRRSAKLQAIDRLEVVDT